MSKVIIDPDAESYPILPTAGEYGTGLQYEADVTLVRFEWPAEERLPAFDPDGDRGPYAYLGFEVQLHDGGKVFVDQWEGLAGGSGSKAPQFMRDLGCPMEETELDGRPTQAFDTQWVTDQLPLKVTGIKVKDPTKSKKTGREYTGNVTGIIV